MTDGHEGVPIRKLPTGVPGLDEAGDKPLDAALKGAEQIGFTIGGLIMMFVVSRIDYHNFQKPWVVYTILGGTVLLLLMVFGFPAINGARRWIPPAAPSSASSR